MSDNEFLTNAISVVDKIEANPVGKAAMVASNISFNPADMLFDIGLNAVSTGVQVNAYKKVGEAWDSAYEQIVVEDKARKEAKEAQAYEKLLESLSPSSSVDAVTDNGQALLAHSPTLGAVDFVSGALAAIGAVSAIAGLFKRKKKKDESDKSGTDNPAMMMMQQLMQQQMIQSQANDASDQVDTEDEKLKKEAAELRAEISSFKNSIQSRPSPAPQHSAKDMTASHVFTKGPTKAEQFKQTSKKSNSYSGPSQKPTEHSMIKKEKKSEKQTDKEKPQSHTKRVIYTSSSAKDKDKEE